MWIITKDFIYDPQDKTDRSAVGTHSNAFDRTRCLPYTFRLLDGDGTVYYQGESDCEDFLPLDNFGTGYAGCTSIEYGHPSTDQWTQL